MFLRSARARLRRGRRTPGGPLSEAADLHASASPARQDRNVPQAAAIGAGAARRSSRRRDGQPRQDFSGRVGDPVSAPTTTQIPPVCLPSLERILSGVP